MVWYFQEFSGFQRWVVTSQHTFNRNTLFGIQKIEIWNPNLGGPSFLTSFWNAHAKVHMPWCFQHFWGLEGRALASQITFHLKFHFGIQKLEIWNPDLGENFFWHFLWNLHVKLHMLWYFQKFWGVQQRVVASENIFHPNFPSASRWICPGCIF